MRHMSSRDGGELADQGIDLAKRERRCHGAGSRIRPIGSDQGDRIAAGRSPGSRKGPRRRPIGSGQRRQVDRRPGRELDRSRSPIATFRTDHVRGNGSRNACRKDPLTLTR